MSQSALLQAVRDRLISQLGYVLHRTVDVLPKGRPPGSAGDTFVVVWGQRRPELHNRALVESYEVRVTISVRGGKAPWDRWGDELWLKATKGIEAVSRPIINLIHGAGTNGIALLVAANALITGDVDKFLIEKPLLFRDEQGPEPRGASWWGRPDEDWAGIVTTLVFGYAERRQAIDVAT